MYRSEISIQGSSYRLNSIPMCSTNKDVITLLTTVIVNQKLMMMNLKNIETRMTKLEKANNDIIIQRRDALTQNTALIKLVHQSLCCATQETDLETEYSLMNDIRTTLPISTFDVSLEVEEKLKNLEYEMLMKTHIFKLKGTTGTLDDVLKRLFTDEFTFQYNIDGKFGKKSFMQMTLIHKTLFDVFQKEGRIEYDKGVRKYLELSHNRYRQRQHHVAKKNKQ